MGHPYITAGLLVTAIGLMAAPGSAAPPVSFYLEALEEGGENAEWTKVILHSYVEAFDWSNAALIARGQQPLYCPPSDLDVVAEQNVAIFKRFVRDMPASQSDDSAMVMLLALQHTYPCPPSN